MEANKDHNMWIDVLFVVLFFFLCFIAGYGSAMLIIETHETELSQYQEEIHVIQALEIQLEDMRREGE